MKSGNHGKERSDFSRGVCNPTVASLSDDDSFTFNHSIDKDEVLASGDSLAPRFADRDGEEFRSSEYLVVVNEDDFLPRNGRCTSTKRRFSSCLLALVMVTVAVVSVVVVTTRKGNQESPPETLASGGVDFGETDNVFDNSASVTPSSAPTVPGQATTAFKVLQPLVENATALLDIDTPQGKAFRRVLGSSDTFQLQQEFGLMTLFYATGGGDDDADNLWGFSHGWDTVSSLDQCQWAGVTICRNSNLDGVMAVAALSLGKTV
jgi:hypothetical protein